jgi:hypothetical protein
LIKNITIIPMDEERILSNYDIYLGSADKLLPV